MGKRGAKLTPTMGRLMGLALLSAALGTSVAAVGQDRGPRAGGRPEAAAPTAAEAGEGGDDVGVDTTEVSEGAGKVKVFKFSGLDISGRLKSPSLLYFLNRLRAEFDHPRLPHRSFMPELVRSTKGKAF